MTTVGDVIRIKDCQTLFGTRLCNIFYYLVAAWTGNADLTDILTAFEDVYIDNVVAMQTPSLKHVNLRADNITDELSFAEEAIDRDGIYTTDLETLPSFVAISFTLSRATKLTRPGLKRIAGISESLQDDGITDPSFTVIEDTGLNIAADIAVNTPSTADGLITPVIVGRNPDGSYDLNRVNPVVSCVASAQLTSQVTRKLWRA